MYVCMYIAMHIAMYACMYVHLIVIMFMYMYILKVLCSIRISLSYQGRKAIAVCWKDISHLSFPLCTICEAIKISNMGVNHVARDFLPKDSDNVIIKRDHNSYSRKCSIIWTDSMATDPVAKPKLGCYNRLTNSFNKLF